MLVLSLNIRHGGGDRVKALQNWIAAKIPDIVVLSEWRDNPSGTWFRSALQQEGFFIDTAVRPLPRSNGLLIAARQSFTLRRITPPSSSAGELALIDLTGGFRLLAGYFPQLKAKVPFFEQCLTEAMASSDRPFMLIGDLNTGRNDLDIEGRGVPFACADLFLNLQDHAGLIDLWRAVNGEQRDWTWRSRINGFRVDHAFGNATLVDRYPAVRCWLDHEPRLANMTDHSAILVHCGQP
jgi:exonuclease III